MGLPIHRRNNLPRRFPVGAKYVVEGHNDGEGSLRVIARYVVLPGGRRINVPADIPPSTPPRFLPFRRISNGKPVRAKAHAQSGGRKLAGRRGTA